MRWTDRKYFRLFLACDAMLFASLFAGYVVLRFGAVTWPDRFHGFPWLETVLLVGATAAFDALTIPLDRKPRAWLDVRSDQAGH